MDPTDPDPQHCSTPHPFFLPCIIPRVSTNDGCLPSLSLCLFPSVWFHLQYIIPWWVGTNCICNHSKNLGLNLLLFMYQTFVHVGIKQIRYSSDIAQFAILLK
jgi:hypothetical protein